jgi:hypothetical protein
MPFVCEWGSFAHPVYPFVGLHLFLGSIFLFCAPVTCLVCVRMLLASLGCPLWFFCALSPCQLFDVLNTWFSWQFGCIILQCYKAGVFFIPLIIFQPLFSLLYCPRSHFPPFWKCPWKKSAAKPKSTATTPGHGWPFTRSKVVKSKEFNEVDEVLVFGFPCNVLFTPC